MTQIRILKRRLRKAIKNPKLVLKLVLIKILYFVSPFFNDSVYLKLLFPLKTGSKLDLDNPQTYNEKLQWLKIHFRKPEFTRMVDKFEVKEYARQIIGDEYIIKNYGVWDSFAEIEFEDLPRQFVLKTTHDSGSIIIVKDKAKFNKKEAKKKLEKCLKRKFFYLAREWPYKDVKPRILAEEFLYDGEKTPPADYKFYCFHGEPRVMLIATERGPGTTKFNYYDMNLNLMNLMLSGPQSKKKLDMPKELSKMIKLSRMLSAELPHVRVDFYEIKGKVFLGELTFFDSGGMASFYPPRWDHVWGSWIDLEGLMTNGQDG